MSIEKRVQVMINTPTIYLGKEFNNNLYMKREDMIPYSFGGNKARKGFLFFEEIDKGNYDCVVTYGSSHSNHCGPIIMQGILLSAARFAIIRQGIFLKEINVCVIISDLI